MRFRTTTVRRRTGTAEKGAVAVELALVLPIFLLLVLGIFEFGRAFNIQVSLSEAARESARYAAVHSQSAGFKISDAQAAGVAAAPTVPLAASDIVISFSAGSPCSSSASADQTNVISNITYSTGFITGLETMIGAPKPFTIKGVGVMRCGG